MEIQVFKDSVVVYTPGYYREMSIEDFIAILQLARDLGLNLKDMLTDKSSTKIIW